MDTNQDLLKQLDFLIAKEDEACKRFSRQIQHLQEIYEGHLAVRRTLEAARLEVIFKQ